MILKPNQHLGIIKFFRKESNEYLDQLISGLFHCQTPEVYRNSELEGVSDRVESCVMSYRSHRNDHPIEIEISGHKITGIIDATIHNGGQTDSWLHCWMSLRLPENETSLRSLQEDIKRMKENFGENFVFVPSGNIEELCRRILKASKKPLSCKEVAYDEDHNRWGTFCKSPSYAYQREYRFAFGECSPTEVTPYCFRCPEGFGDLMYKNPDLKLESHDRKNVWLDLAE